MVVSDGITFFQNSPVKNYTSVRVIFKAFPFYGNDHNIQRNEENESTLQHLTKNFAEISPVELKRNIQIFSSFVISKIYQS